jgi:tripartite-type tricarboxylate transporter receptor subunit TctC
MHAIARCAFAGVLVTFGILAASPGFPQGTNWPTKPVRFVVPFPPGGSNDALARLLAARLVETYGQPFIVVSESGRWGKVVRDNRIRPD